MKAYCERVLEEEDTIGNVNENVDPCPTILSTATSPPCNSINFLAIVRPNPVPPKRRFVLPSAWRNASKIWPNAAGEMPMPESCTETRSILQFSSCMQGMTPHPC